LHYLLGSRGTYTQSIQNQSEELSSESTTLTGVTYGLRRWDLSPQIGYEVQISPQIHMGMLYQWGLMDMTRDQIWKQDQKDRQRLFQFTLNYRLR
ncbi:MAG: hypothetical protein AAFR59_13105, partial [Bacteroidota bacterium]